MDIVDRRTRSRMMAGIGPRNTSPEKHIRNLLFSSGFRYRLHDGNLPGKPDIILRKYRLVIFVHGCFWHCHQGCRYFRWPGTREEFWREKLLGNAQRDTRVHRELAESGWRVLVIWECVTRDPAQLEKLRNILPGMVRGNEGYCEVPPVVTGASPSEGEQIRGNR